MVFEFFPNLKSPERGITLIEIIIAIFIIGFLSVIMISDFPKIQRQSALSRSVYRIAQDVRRAQDMGLSGVQLKDVNDDPILVKGFGVYFAKSEPVYMIYADVADELHPNGSQTFENRAANVLCEEYNSAINVGDCVIERVDISKESASLYIEDIRNVTVDTTSINFRPPSPIIDIENLDGNKIGIVLGLLPDSSYRTVWVNTSGLISVE